MTIRLPLAALVALGAIAPVAQAQLLPVVAASIHDEPRDGLGDTFNDFPFTGLLREQATREDRAVLEYDVSEFVGQGLLSASVSGTIRVNNSFDNGVRTFDVSLYAGNGQADLSDFEIGSVVVGSTEYHPPFDTFVDFTFDVTGAAQKFLDQGENFIGLKVDCTSDPNFPSILDEKTTLFLDPGIPDCEGGERVRKANCKQNNNGRNKLTVKLKNGLPGDGFTVRLDTGETRNGTLGDDGRAAVRFKRLPAGPGVATANWDCGAEDSREYNCP